MSSAAVLYATALVLEFITGIDVVMAIVIITTVAFVYTSLGGISAVIWTDVMQAVLLLIGGGIVLYSLISELPMGLHESLLQLSDKGKTNAIDTTLTLYEDTTIWAGVFAMTLYHVTVYGANQMMVQRTLAAKSIGDAKKSYLLMGYAAFFIYFLFLLIGIFLFQHYDGQSFENGNTIILQFVNELAIPGLMGIIAAAVLPASMSSLDSAFNSMSTVTTVDFYQKYVNKEGTSEHYLKVSRWFTLLFAILIIVPALLYVNRSGSILVVLSKVGSYFVGAKLSMFALGFFSKHTTEKGLLLGVVIGFAVVWYTATQTEITWPWFAVIGGGVNVLASLIGSLILDGKQSEFSPYTVKGQIKTYQETGQPEKQDGWYVVPGKIDRASKYLLVYFCFTLLLTWIFTATYS